MEAVVNKMGGMEGVDRFLQDELILVPKNGQTSAVVSISPKVWPIYFSVKNDKSLRTADDFRQDLEPTEHKIGTWASNILDRADLLEGIDEDEYHLAAVTGKMLQFRKEMTRKAFFDRALKPGNGLAKVPARVGPLLRKQLVNQPKGDFRLLGMEPVADSDGGLCVFFVKRDDVGESWLRTLSGYPESRWDPDSVWLFLCSKSA